MNRIIKKIPPIVVAFVCISIVVALLIMRMYFSSSRTSQIISSSNTDNIFVNISAELLRQNSTISLEPTVGSLIMTSLVSHKKDKVVYAEISDCIKAVNDYDETTLCNWNYQVFVKNIQTGKREKIYSYPEEMSFGVKKVHAGGCSIVYLPIAWSKNDQKIILQWGNPTDCGSGGAPRYLTYSINPDGSSLENLSTYQPIFLNDYEKVVYIEESPQSPPVCGPVTQANNGKIVLIEIESGETTTLLEERNSEYSLLSADEMKSVVKYSAQKILNVNGCSEIDSSAAKKIGQIRIP